MADRPRRPVRTAVVHDLLSAALEAARSEYAAAGHGLDVVDAGGGTGGFAVPLARAGHRVTVVDPSPDALAALERRAAEAGVTERVRAVQGDAADLLDVVAAGSADAVLGHGVLEVVDDPAAAVAGMAAVLRPGGLASVLAAQRHATVLARAAAGHLLDARHALTDPDGRWGPGDPLPRRFDEAGLLSLLDAAGLAVREVHGVRVFTDLVPGTLVDEPGASDALLDLETAVASHPAFRSVAAQLHVLAVRT
ncbi:MAG TPA: methyltransferase domain-containing protein [Jiangellales bacterium]|nr:methyltransferase domain-containing protein [Jiangellales bacterium]